MMLVQTLHNSINGCDNTGKVYPLDAAALALTLVPPLTPAPSRTTSSLTSASPFSNAAVFSMARRPFGSATSTVSANENQSAERCMLRTPAHSAGATGSFELGKDSSAYGNRTGTSLGGLCIPEGASSFVPLPALTGKASVEAGTPLGSKSDESPHARGVGALALEQSVFPPPQLGGAQEAMPEPKHKRVSPAPLACRFSAAFRVASCPHSRASTPTLHNIVEGVRMLEVAHTPRGRAPAADAILWSAPLPHSRSHAAAQQPSSRGGVNVLARSDEGYKAASKPLSSSEDCFSRSSRRSSQRRMSAPESHPISVPSLSSLRTPLSPLSSATLHSVAALPPDPLSSAISRLIGAHRSDSRPVSTAQAGLGIRVHASQAADAGAFEHIDKQFLPTVPLVNDSSAAPQAAAANAISPSLLGLQQRSSGSSAGSQEGVWDDDSVQAELGAGAQSGEGCASRDAAGISQVERVSFWDVARVQDYVASVMLRIGTRWDCINVLKIDQVCPRARHTQPAGSD